MHPKISRGGRGQTLARAFADERSSAVHDRSVRAPTARHRVRQRHASTLARASHPCHTPGVTSMKAHDGLRRRGLLRAHAPSAAVRRHCTHLSDNERARKSRLPLYQQKPACTCARPRATRSDTCTQHRLLSPNVSILYTYRVRSKTNAKPVAVGRGGLECGGRELRWPLSF